MARDASGPHTRPSLLLRIRDPQDQAAWNEFVASYAPLIYPHCRRRRLQDADAANVTQEVLLRIAHAIRTFEYRPERGRFRDWLYTTTKNEINQWLRKMPCEVSLDGVSPPEAKAEPDPFEVEFLRDMIRIALERTRLRLQEPTWRAFEQSVLHHRPTAEVAQELDRPIEWVHMARFRGRKQFRHVWFDLTGEPDFTADGSGGGEPP